MPSPILDRQLAVEWGQCDPAGTVFNSRFFELRHQYLASVSIGPASIWLQYLPEVIARFGQQVLKEKLFKPIDAVGVAVKFELNGLN